MGVALGALTIVGACANEGLEQLPPASQTAQKEDPAALMRLGDRMRLSGNIGAASNFYNRVLAQQPNNVTALNHLGDMAWQSNLLQEAAGYYGQVLSLDPGNAAALSGRARIMMAQGDPFGAIALIDQLEANGGAGVESLYSRGIAYDLLGRQSDAQILYREGLSEAPADLRLKNSLALSLAISGNYRGALDLLREIADASPEGAAVRQSLALVYALSGQVATAMELTPGEGGGQVNRVFYGRLSGLSPAQKADAIYFRRLPTLEQQLVQQEQPDEDIPELTPVQPKVVSIPPELREESSEEMAEEGIEDTPEEAQLAEDEQPATSSNDDIIETGGYFVQLGSFRRVEAVELAWAQVTGKSEMAGQNHVPRVQLIETEDRGTYLRVVLGPFEEKIDAETNCDALKADNVECFVVFNRLPAQSLSSMKE